jgi:hypothetical protein
MGTGLAPPPDPGGGGPPPAWPHAVVPNIISAIFAREKAFRLEGATVEISCSFMEIQETSNKSLRDLLDPLGESQRASVEALRRIKVVTRDELEVGSNPFPHYM